MKAIRIAIVLFLFVSIHSVKGQSYFIDGKTFDYQMDTMSEGFSRGIEVFNTGTVNIDFTWERIQLDTLIDSEFDLCNCGECWSYMRLSGFMPTIPPGGFGWLKIHMYSGKVCGLNTIRYLLKGPGTVDTLTFLIQVGQPTGIRDTWKTVSHFHVYPNPAKDHAVVGLKLENRSSVELTVSDITGKVVYHNDATAVNAGTSEIRINTSEWETGTYNIDIKTKEGIRREKLVVVK